MSPPISAAGSAPPVPRTDLASLRRAVRNSPNSASAHLNLAIALSDSKFWKEAQSEFQTALRLRPNDPLALCNLGLNALRAAQSMGAKSADYYGQLESAQISLLKAVALDPHLPHIHQHLGWLYHEVGDQSSALEEFRKGSEAEPDSAEAFNNFGTALAESQQYEAAIVAYERAFALAPDSASTAINLIGAIRRAGKETDALQRYEAQVLAHMESAPDHLLFGLALYWNHLQDRSAAEFHSAVERQPTLPVAHFYLAKLFHEANQNDRAEAECRLALSQSPDRPEFMELLAASLLDEGKLPEAESVLRRALRHDPDDSSLHYVLGKVLQRRKLPAEAAREFAETSRLKEQSSAQGKLAMSLARGIRQLRAGDVATAVSSLREAYDLDPAYPETNYYLGIALSQTGDLDGSTQAFERALRRRPTSGEIHYNFGIALWQHGQPVRAVAEFRRATLLRPDDALAHCALGLALLHNGVEREGQSEVARSQRLGGCVRQDASAN